MYHMYTSIKCPLLYFLLHSIVINRNIDIFCVYKCCLILYSISVCHVMLCSIYWVLVGYIIKGRNATLRRKSNLSLISFKLIRVNCIQLI